MGTFDAIFAEEPARGKYQDDVVARVRTGHAVKQRPVALAKFRFTSVEEDVLECLAESFGGTVQQWDNEKEPLEVFSDTDSLNVIFDDASAITAGLVMFSRTNALLRSCDGKSITGGDEEGSSCKCPLSLQDKKDAQARGTGCGPNISIRFRLADMPALGMLRLNSGAWGLAKDLGKTEAALARIDGPAAGRIWLELVEWTDGKTGKERSFFKLHVDVFGPVSTTKAPF